MRRAYCLPRLKVEAARLQLGFVLVRGKYFCSVHSHSSRHGDSPLPTARYGLTPRQHRGSRRLH